MQVQIYTDGSSRGNPGPGGYGIVMTAGQYQKEFAKGFRKTTNNRMELLAVIVALEKLKKLNTQVVVTSDSKYVVDSVSKRWVFNWEKKNFSGKKNADLWQRFLQVYRLHKVRFVWVKGHNNHPMNERCDRLAVWAAEQSDLEIDFGYEREERGLL